MELFNLLYWIYLICACFVLLPSLVNRMSDENSTGSASTSNLTAETESSESAVEINVKTLDSQIYRFRVARNMPVPSLKEKVASASGVPVEQQRLIFRGKVLKDDHLLSEYHVEDGDTLHLVVRQVVQSQTSSGTNSGESGGSIDNRGNDASTGASRTRVGVSHSVVLGSFNVGDQGGEGNGGTDLSRIIGAVLNSIGIGNSIGGAINSSSGVPSNVSTQASQGVETDATRGNIGGRSQAGNQMPAANHPSQTAHQNLPFPFRNAAVVVPSPQMPIPDALHTLSEFINSMELALSATGYWPSSSPTDGEGAQGGNLPSNSRGMPTPEALSVILRRAHHLISGHAIAALSHIAGRLEGEGSSTDPAVRNQIQTESVQVGLAMQHLGSLLLELGRTTLTLRMGQSPLESVVNAGPAVYISPSGPNPIMVQPFPLQTSSLFGGSASSPANFGTMGPVGPGDALRNVNIHIHAVGSRATNGEHTHQERPNGSHSGGPGSTRGLPVRSVIAAAVPPRSANAVHSHGRTQQNNDSQTVPSQSPGIVASSTTQSSVDPVPQSPSESVSNPTLVAELNAQIRNILDNTHGLSGQSEDSTRDGNDQQENLAVNGAEDTGGDMAESNSAKGEQKQPECHQHTNEGEIGGSCSLKEASSASSTGIISGSPGGETTFACKKEESSETSKSGPSHDPQGTEKAVPLGLGLGGLQPKRRSTQVRSQKNVGGTDRVPPANENQQSIARGQQVLQSLVSHGSNANASDTNGPSGQLRPAFAQSIPTGRPESSGQLDAASMMSQVLNSPALNGLLAGVSNQAGIGSPNVLRNMLEQFTQSPSIRNTLDSIVQQIDGQELSNFAGMGRGQGGGIDLSRMVQQMMPIVSQALTRGPTTPEPYGLDSGEQRLSDMGEAIRDDKPNEISQIDLQGVAQRIERNDPPGEIFRTVVEHTASLCSGGGSQDLVEELCSDDDLANAFMEMLCRQGH
ncbi:Ubiquitin-like domain-containing protein cip73 [Thalictrum thalictroides]|uniref:Ubiquitin-like domain-containing protein cip73 n=1 Tax=Thalictrum thalictroides TaxID=46969 RepID=A0A7J6VGP9_THATH|nr:Ubiquitin-like domain-containing protein cip73 [Thalictrum thalictroides]